MNSLEYSAKIETKLNEYFKNLFSDYYIWMREKKTFIYEDDKVKDTIHYDFGKGENENYYIMIIVCRTIKIIDELWKGYRHNLGITRGVMPTFCADNDEMCGRISFEIAAEKYLDDRSFIEDSVAKIIFLYENDAYPAIERMSYIEKLNYYYNLPVNKKFGKLNFNKLIVAKFSNIEYEKVLIFLINLYKRIADKDIKKEKKENAELYLFYLSDLDDKLKNISLLSDTFLGSKKHPLYIKKNIKA